MISFLRRRRERENDLAWNDWISERHKEGLGRISQNSYDLMRMQKERVPRHVVEETRNDIQTVTATRESG